LKYKKFYKTKAIDEAEAPEKNCVAKMLRVKRLRAKMLRVKRGERG